MVTNEDLVELFKSTENNQSKNIIFKELYSRLGKGAIKIYNFYVKLLQPRNREEFIEESQQESMICLLNSIDKFKPDKGNKFITFYYTCFKNHLSQFYKDQFTYNINEISNSLEIENLSDEFVSPDKMIDNSILHNIFKEQINNIDFQRDMHKKVFLDWIGFNKNREYDSNFASLGRKYNLSRMAVKKICDKYFANFKEILENNNKLEEIRIFL